MTERRELLEILPDGNRLVRVTMTGRGLAGEDYTFITVEPAQDAPVVTLRPEGESQA
jgi:hypothetical protein